MFWSAETLLSQLSYLNALSSFCPFYEFCDVGRGENFSHQDSIGGHVVTIGWTFLFRKLSIVSAIADEASAEDVTLYCWFTIPIIMAISTDFAYDQLFIASTYHCNFSWPSQYALGHVIENRFHRRFDGGLVCHQGQQESSFSLILMLFQTCRLVTNCELVENTV